MYADKEFITYGFKIDLNSITRPDENSLKAHYINKPDYGLWGSPVDSEFGWKDWCEMENFNISSFKSFTKWKLKPDAKILVIDSFSDLTKAMDRYGIENIIHTLDYYEISKEYDGVWLTASGNAECHYPNHYKNFYVDMNAWDCDSIVVWNPDVVEIIESNI